MTGEILADTLVTISSTGSLDGNVTAQFHQRRKGRHLHGATCDRAPEVCSKPNC